MGLYKDTQASPNLTKRIVALYVEVALCVVVVAAEGDVAVAHCELQLL